MARHFTVTEVVFGLIFMLREICLFQWKCSWKTYARLYLQVTYGNQYIRFTSWRCKYNSWGFNMDGNLNDDTDEDGIPNLFGHRWLMGRYSYRGWNKRCNTMYLGLFGQKYLKLSFNWQLIKMPSLFSEGIFILKTFSFKFSKPTLKINFGQSSVYTGHWKRVHRLGYLVFAKTSLYL